MIMHLCLRFIAGVHFIFNFPSIGTKREQEKWHMPHFSRLFTILIRKLYQIYKIKQMCDISHRSLVLNLHRFSSI